MLNSLHWQHKNRECILLRLRQLIRKCRSVSIIISNNGIGVRSTNGATTITNTTAMPSPVPQPEDEGISLAQYLIERGASVPG